MDAGNIALHCAPAINLFPKRADIIHLSDKFSEFHVVPARTRPMDYEVYRVTGVTGYGVRSDDRQTFSPFYSASDFADAGGSGAYFTVNRTPRLMSSREKKHGRRSSYGAARFFCPSWMLRRRPIGPICGNWRWKPCAPTGICPFRWGLAGENGL